MKFQLETRALKTLPTDCLVLPVFEKKKLSPTAKAIDKLTKGGIARILRLGDFTGELAQTTMLYDLPGIKAQRILLIGCGDLKKLTDPGFKNIVTALMMTLKNSSVKNATVCFSDLSTKTRDSGGFITQAVIHGENALYTFDQMKSKNPGAKKPTFTTCRFHVASATKSAKNALAVGEAIAQGMTLCKDLAHLPGNVCTPTYLAKIARQLGRTYTKLNVSVMEEAQMKKLGMNALLAVSQGSAQPAKLITLQYKGGKASEKPIALVGKGVTFDSGGISLKPGQNMEDMKYDMTGAASVLGTLKAIATLRLPINVVGVIPTTENLPSGTAVKPGDIVKGLSGISIEIINTDAEGRLILSDALTYAKKFKPKHLIDIATLTGACVIALGKHNAGLMSRDDKLAHAIYESGKTIADTAWRLPLNDQYDEQINSRYADIANSCGRDGSAITAGCFLGRFTKDESWAHLDIAGVAWETGSTGRPVPLLTQFLIDQAK